MADLPQDTVVPRYERVLATRCAICDLHHISRDIICDKCKIPPISHENRLFHAQELALARKAAMDIWRRFRG